MKDEFTLETEEPLPTPERLAVGCSDLLAVAFGGGVNSTAMLCGFREQGIKPDLITMADTGAEMPETHHHLAEMQEKVKEWWGMEIQIVKTLRGGEFEGLAAECLRGKKLPALAYGSRACSVKYKHAPQNKLLKRIMKERGITLATRAIGFDAGESHRNKVSTDKWAENWYPLIEWGWRRQDCIEEIQRHGIKLPGKSACFMCPAMKQWEILKLKKDHPQLFADALKMERQANSDEGANKHEIGLTGRKMKWADIANADESQAKLWNWLDENDESPIPCGCFDG